MNDITPDEMPYWHRLEASARSVLAGYGFREIRPPILERTELFQRSIGDVTDIVEKEMYTFIDRGGDSLTLRPECTASCVRAALEHGLVHHQVQRLWYMGPMFRHERPQKGRYRQFHQIGAEALGLPEPEVDVELMLVCARLWRALGLRGLTLEVNSLGSRATQAAYRERLTAYFSGHPEALDEDSRRRLHTNPLRILDSKNPAMQELIAGAPRLLDHLDEASLAHFERVRAALDACGLSYRVNPRLVRGLDYYTHTVFEWTTDRLGAQAAVCGGGRYDTLVAEIGGGGRATPASGFAMGMERLVELLALDQTTPPEEVPQVYLAALGERPRLAAHRLAEGLRDALEGIALVVDAGAGSLKAKLRRADRMGARIALLLGEEELTGAAVTLKRLREQAAQERVAEADLPARLRALLYAPQC